jgi:predicted O-methyltransferase YrrM
MFIADFRLKTAVQKLLCSLLEVIDFPILHPKRELQRRAVNETVDYIVAHASKALAMDTAKDVLIRALRDAKSVSGMYMEFGVFKGATINFMAHLYPEKEIWGFDSFEGLPERWTGNTSSFDAGGKLPEVRSNVTLVRGWFDRTLPAWLVEHREPIAFVHIDCDVYSSTKIIFDGIGSQLQPGAIIVFDEYFGYPGWQHHEYRAFQEFVEANGIRYEYLYFARIQCAVEIIQNPLFTTVNER